MATSSIFHNVILTEPKQVEAFINALEASEADPYIAPRTPLSEIMMSRDELKRLHELWLKRQNVTTKAFHHLHC